MALLSKYGGYWIDSTYLVSTPFTKVNSSFFTLKLNYCWTNALPFITCQWSGNFIATSKNSFIATFGYNAFLYYWKKYNSLIYYFLIDYIIYTAYNTEKRFKKKIEALPFTTCDIFSLKKSLNMTYNKTDFRCPFNKLSKNKKCNKTIGINDTNYGYLINLFINYLYPIKFSFNARKFLCRLYFRILQPNNSNRISNECRTKIKFNNKNRITP